MEKTTGDIALEKAKERGRKMSDARPPRLWNKDGVELHPFSTKTDTESESEEQDE